MNANILNLLIQLKNEWVEFQHAIDKVNITISKIVGEEKIEKPKIDDILKWERVLQEIIKLNKKVTFQDIIKEMKLQGIEDTRKEELRIRSVVYYLIKKEKISRNGSIFEALQAIPTKDNASYC